MKGYLVDTPDEAKQIIKELIKDDKLIVSGGTMTLKETGIQDFLNENYSGIYIDREKLSPDEVNDLYRKAFSADTYFASTNAITEYGRIIQRRRHRQPSSRYDIRTEAGNHCCGLKQDCNRPPLSR